MFSMTGLKNGKSFSIRMDNLQMSGDRAMVSVIQKAASDDHGLLGISPNQETRGRYLNNECSAADLARLCFDKELAFTCDWYDGVPDDALF
jgi:hypothetical protein